VYTTVIIVKLQYLPSILIRQIVHPIDVSLGGQQLKDLSITHVFIDSLYPSAQQLPAAKQL
jgi:hypothetical protein